MSSKRKRDPKSKNKGKPQIQKFKRGQVEDKIIKEVEKSIQEFDLSTPITTFNDLPISSKTKKGLQKAFFTTPTDVQSRSIPLTLKGHDIHTTARTGSGKTLAFLIPLLEILYRKKWGTQDGLGALVISPTRELAVQTFDVLRRIGGYHNFSAGLVIGGRKVEEEGKRIGKMNILIATPGRLLQHLDQAVGFDCDDLQMLVLDEADRILDMGFSKTINAILSHFPKNSTRQTLLFSATSSADSESIASLARLSLNNPITLALSSDISLDPAPISQESSQPDASTTTPTPTLVTPTTLTQHYTLTPLPQKFDTLFSFIKSHLTSKILVFASTTKQVRFIYRSLVALTPGTKLLHLHGQMSLKKRLEGFEGFKRASGSGGVKENAEGKEKQSGGAVMISTDIASRGLDFPSIHWVLQFDCPSDVSTYIHRVGRTARHTKSGNALLFLDPSEMKFVERLKGGGVKIEEIKVREKKVESCMSRLQLFAFRDVEVKYLAQRAFISYVRSIYLNADKEVFKLEELPLKDYAESLGLAGVPKVKFLTDSGKGRSKNKSRSSFVSEGEAGSLSKKEVRTKYDRMFERKNQNVLSEHYKKIIDQGSEDEDGDEFDVNESSEEEDFITLARADHDLPEDPPSLATRKKTKQESGKKEKQKDDNPLKGILPASATAVLSTSKSTPIDPDCTVSKRALKAGTSKKAMLKHKGVPQKLTFDEEGDAHEAYDIQEVDPTIGREGWREMGRNYLEEIKEDLERDDERDRGEARERRREMKKKRKEKERLAREGEVGGKKGGEARVAVAEDEEDGYVSPEFDLPPGSSDNGEDEEDERPAKRKKVFRSGGDMNKEGWGGIGVGDEIDGDELERLAIAALGR